MTSARTATWTSWLPLPLMLSGGLFDHIKMQQELQALLQRNVDLISKRALARSQNWLRRQEILSTAQILFAEQEATQTMKV